ncbi:MAG: fumarylacetoacetate hydrolase family protein [Chloroflexia bacterium]|nr:fumarylacetoacetate hydrolase family protein [Chloroflexia bacterium]
MKLVHTAEFGIGVLRDDGVVDVSAIFEDIPYRSAVDRMPRILGAFHERRDQVEKMAASADITGSATILAPVPRPPKLIAAFRNYFEGVDRERREQDMFLESPDSVLDPGGTVVLPPHPATIFHHEAELGLVIGKRSKDLPADEGAYEALAGYTCAMDVSGRGIGRMGPSRIGKSFSTFTPLGPAIVTPDEVGDPQQLQITLIVNGQQRQSYSTADMEYPVVEMLAFLSSYMTLVPGDVIMCGTNHQGLGPLQHGDHELMEIEKVGRLEVDVVDEQRRTWPYEVDQEMAARARG